MVSDIWDPTVYAKTKIVICDLLILTEKKKRKKERENRLMLKERMERWRYGNPTLLPLLLNNDLIEVNLSFCFQQVDVDDEYEQEEEEEEEEHVEGDDEGEVNDC